MKPLHLILAASIAANAAIVSVVCLKPSTTGLFSLLSNKSRNSSSTEIETASGQKIDLAETIASRNPQALRDQLRALGVPEEIVRRMVRTLLWEPYYARYRALVAQHKNDKPDLLRSHTFSTGFTKAEHAELRALSHDINQQTLALLGSISPEPDIDNLRFSYLPQDKADQLRMINRDYAEMRNDLEQEIGRFHIASDDEKLKLLEQERHKDIETLLSPAELQEYNLRNSSTASVLRNRLANVNVSDDEFRNLYDLLKPVYENNLPPIKSGEQLTADQLAQLSAQRDLRNQADEQIKAFLGDERYAEYSRNGNNDYRNLQAAAMRFDLAPQAIQDVYNLRNNVSTESQQIANDTSLAPQQKKEALANLADQTRNQVRSVLGPDIGDTYLKTSMQWLDRVGNGYTVSFSASGNGTSFKSVTARSASSPAAATTTQK